MGPCQMSCEVAQWGGSKRGTFGFCNSVKENLVYILYISSFTQTLTDLST